MKFLSLFIFISLVFALQANAQSVVTFKSKDRLVVTADYYHHNEKSPVIILCHQDGYSRGEYIQTAKRLVKLGYNCLVPDLRSGSSVLGIENKTAELAKVKKLPAGYLDAKQDIEASVDYIFKQYNSKVILAGSSYSASLAMMIGKTNDKVRAVVAFSPGEYFDEKIIVQQEIKGFNKPLFVTSARSEAESEKKLLKGVNPRKKIHFIPSNEGVHGAQALWVSNLNHNEYWENLIHFLEDLKKPL